MPIVRTNVSSYSGPIALHRWLDRAFQRTLLKTKEKPIPFSPLPAVGLQVDQLGFVYLTEEEREF